MPSIVHLCGLININYVTNSLFREFAHASNNLHFTFESSLQKRNQTELSLKCCSVVCTENNHIQLFQKTVKPAVIINKVVRCE